MNVLRDMARSDKAIGSITSDECHLIAAVLDLAARSRLIRACLPKECRGKALAFRMLAATLGRTPSEREPCLATQIKLKMEADRGTRG